jgi:hypothetical protein
MIDTQLTHAERYQIAILAKANFNLNCKSNGTREIEQQP